ncbi:MAG: hypothetical protein K1X94_03130 [Sandaracinaceae bacterium]|nr:hypothetical protein [Sandaracinaceae bacterium]
MSHPAKVIVACSLFCLGLAACAAERGPTDRAPEPARTPSRAERLATIGIAQGLLHETDVLEGLGQRREAIARAERVLGLELAADDPLREPLRLDAHGRLAELALAEGALDEADHAIDRGLAEVTSRSYFEARLHLVRGRVLEARAASAREAGDAARAEELLRSALAEHEQSIAINEGLLGGHEGTP